MRFSSREEPLREDWNVRLLSPFSGGTLCFHWFAKDMKTLEGVILHNLSGVPPSALGWGDVAFRSFLARETLALLPGWYAVPMIRLPGEGGAGVGDLLCAGTSSGVGSGAIPAV